MEGSKAFFTDSFKTGLIATIRESRVFQKILIQNIGLINNGHEDYDSEEAIESREFYEQYLLEPEGNYTKMCVEVVVEYDFYKNVSTSWKEALKTIKMLAESKRP